MREATIDDLPAVCEFGREFADLAGIRLEYQPFINFWVTAITGSIGKIFMCFKDEEINGILGALKFQDPLNGELSVTEMFWFTDPRARGQGVRLFDKIEEWAEEIGAKKVIMVHLVNSMPDKLERFYINRDYRKQEVHYVKEINNGN